MMPSSIEEPLLGGNGCSVDRKKTKPWKVLLLWLLWHTWKFDMRKVDISQKGVVTAEDGHVPLFYM